MKRLFDLALALPLLVLVWLVCRKLGSPVFFHEVRPGITGWAQVNGRNAISAVGEATMPKFTGRRHQK